MNADKLLVLLYPVIKDFPEAPVSPLLLSKSLNIDEDEVHEAFIKWLPEGYLEKKYSTVDIYRFTEKGIRAVELAFAESKKKDHTEE